jgi:undecaprenyl-diphosphatase
LDILAAIVLGIIQGLTEFLPVSSSGHLELAKAVLGTESMPEESMLTTVVLHFATAMSTVVVFRQDIAQILRGIFQFRWNEESEFAIKIIVSMIPAALVGLFFNDQIEALFSGQTLFVGLMLIVTGALLFLADRAKRTEKKVGMIDAAIIGVAQAIAILPGISRSGATISTSVLLGIDRGRAARFSFLMVVPLIFGKMAKDIGDGALTASNVEVVPLLLGAIAAFVVGMIACRWMIALVKKSKLISFSIYCIVVGIVAIVLS